MIRRLAGVLLVVCALSSLLSDAAPAEVPAGPRLAVIKWDPRFRAELFTADPLGAARETVYTAGLKRIPTFFPFLHPVWSPDGTEIAFTADVGEENRRFASFAKTAIAVLPAEGGKPVLVRGATGGLDPVFSPDGNRIAFAKQLKRWKPNKHGGGRPVYDSESIWLADLATGSAAQLTPWRNGLRQNPSSFSPDGARLAFTRSAGRGKPQAMSMAIDGSGVEVLAADASEPVYSPDGSRFTFLRGPTKVKTRRHGTDFAIVYAHLTDVYVENVDGSETRRLTSTANAIEFGVSWDPSGQRIAYTRLDPFKGEFLSLGFGDEIREINIDGSCGTKLFSAPKDAFFGAAWQPGAGREAGPISC